MDWQFSGRLGRLRQFVLAWCFSLALFSAGCSLTSPHEWIRNGFKVGPNYAEPAAPAGSEWIQAGDSRIEGPPPRDGKWWDVFQDPVLSSLIVRAYQQNLNLQAIGTRVLQARAQQAISVGNLFPQSQRITGMYDYGKVANEATHINLTAFNLSWELDFWGKYRRQVESAKARTDVSEESYNDALVTLLADVATNYVQFRIAQQRLKIAQENLKTQAELVAIADQQLKVGTVNSVDVNQLRALMRQTSSTIPALRISLGQANDRLCILLGDPPRTLDSELGPGPEIANGPMPLTPVDVSAGVPSDLLLRRPDVRGAEREVAAQMPQIGVAEAQLLPSVSIGAMLGYSNFDLGPQLSTRGPLAFIMPQFSWNILNYGRLANYVKLQDAKTKELVYTYQQKVLTAAQEVQSSLRGFLLSQDQADELSGSASAAAAAAKVQEKIFRDLKSDVNRLSTLENSRLQAQDQLVVAQGNIALNLINVYRALGGGWEILRAENENCAKPIHKQK